MSDGVRQHRDALRTRWRRLAPGQQALLVLAHLRRGETYRDLPEGFGIGTSTVYRHLRGGLELLAAMAPTLAQAIAVVQRKAFATLDGTCCAPTGSAWPAGTTGPSTPGSTRSTGIRAA